MEDNNKVKTKIFGLEYTIAGNATTEEILNIAKYVDGTMKDIAKVMSSAPQTSVAVLSAINITKDLFEAKQKIETLEAENAALASDCEGYTKLWDETKASFVKYKEEAQQSVVQLAELQKLFNDNSAQLTQLADEHSALQKEAEQLRKHLEISQHTLAALQAEHKTQQIALDESELARVVASDELELLRKEIQVLKTEKEAVKAEAAAFQAALVQKQVASSYGTSGKSNQKNKGEEEGSGEVGLLGAMELIDKYKDLENNFFDIQMENLQLKEELDKIKKQKPAGKATK